MKKILGLTIAAILILGLAGAGTWAYFRDTEASTDNSLTAGTLDLQVNGASLGVTTFSTSNIMPGNNGSGSTVLTNNGSVTGFLFVTASPVTNTETTVAEFSDGGTGELGAALNIAIYIDVDVSNSYTAGDIGLKNDGTTYTTALEFQPINTYDSKTWTADANGIETLAPGASDKFHVDWQFPETGADQSNCQGDSVSINFTFALKQIP